MNIIQVLDLYSSIEWARWPPESLKFPPLIVWRFKAPAVDVEVALRTAIASFESSIDWVFETGERNWYIAPSLVTSKRDINLLAHKDPDYGIRANAELKRLAVHLYTFIRNENEL